MKVNYQILLLLFGLALAFACGGGAGSEKASGSSASLRFKAQAGDNILAYDLSGGLTSPGNVLASAIYDVDLGYAEITLDPGQSYRLRLRRNDLEYMETVVLADQFLLTDADGLLDVGEISALTTAMTWAAIKVASISPFLQVDSTLVAVLAEAQGTQIQSLADVNRDNVQGSGLFSGARIAQMNFLVVTIARVSVHFEQNLNLSQAQWSEMVDLIADIITHPTRRGTSAQARSLRDDYITMFNSSGNLSLLVDGSRITNQFVSGNIALDNFVQSAQSVLESDVQGLFGAMGLSFE